MKKTFTAAIAALLVLIATESAQSQTIFGLDRQGAVAEYVRKDSDGDVIGYSKTSVMRIDTVDKQNLAIHFYIELFDEDRTPSGSPLALSAELKDGKFDNMWMNMWMYHAMGFPFYRTDIAVGQTFEEASPEDAVSRISYRETVVSRERVTTPAGTFDCFKIRADITTTTSIPQMGVSNTASAEMTWWVCAGVGIVKAENKIGRTSNSTATLISLKR
jgi:hypothetical protein